MNYEMRLINSIVESGDMVTAVNEGVDGVFAEYRDIWNFILSHYDKHSKPPSKDTIKSHFSDFEFITVTEPLTYYVEQAKRESLALQTRRIVAQAHSLLGELGPKEALSYLMENTSKLYKYSSNLKDTDLAGEWRDRSNELRERSLNPDSDIVGIPSGLLLLTKCLVVGRLETLLFY